MMPERRDRILFVLLLASALAVRCAYVLEARSTEWYSHPRLDALFHDRWALSIASGNILGDSVFFRAPLYPYLLAGVYALAGHSYDAVRILQHLLGAAVVACVFLLARRLYGIAGALVAGCLTAWSAVLVYYEGELLFETLAAALLIVWLLLVAVTGPRDRPLLHSASGLLFGLLCITRPTFLALAPPLFLLLAVRTGRAAGRRVGVRTGVLLLAGCMLAIAPVAIRNRIVGGDFVLVSSQGGINFYIGNNPEADGMSSALPGKGAFWVPADQEAAAERAAGRRLTPSEESSYWYAEGWRFIRTHPGAFASLLAKKLMLFWNSTEIPNNRSFTAVAGSSPVLSLLPVGFWIVGPLGLVGLLLALRSGRGRLEAIVVLLYMTVTVLFFVTGRFRVPVLPVLSVLAGHTVASGVALARRRAYPRLALLGSVSVLAAVFVGNRAVAIATVDPAREEFMQGLIDLAEGRSHDAMEHFAAAAGIRPVPNLHASWGEAAWQAGDTATAIREFRRELEIVPGSAPALASLAMIELARGGSRAALPLAESALASDPRFPGGYVAAARTLVALRREAAAESVLLRGRAVARPPFFYGDFLLTDIRLRRSADVAGADSAYRQLLHGLARVRQPEYDPDLEYGGNSGTGVDDRTLRAYVLYRLGHVAVVRSRLDSAHHWFRSAVATLPGFADAWADCGVTLLRLGRPLAAESCLVHATVIDPGQALYWYNLGVARGEAGEHDRALAAFRTALARKPDFAAAAEALSALEKGR